MNTPAPECEIDVRDVCQRLRAGDLSESTVGRAEEIAINFLRRLPTKARADAISAMAGMLYPDDLRIDLDRNVAVRRGVRVMLPPSHAAVLHVLHARYPTTVPLRDLAVALWGQRYPHHDINAIRQTVVRLRRDIGAVKAGIVNDWGRGYRLVLAPMGV